MSQIKKAITFGPHLVRPVQVIRRFLQLFEVSQRMLPWIALRYQLPNAHFLEHVLGFEGQGKSIHKMPSQGKEGKELIGFVEPAQKWL